MTRFIENEIAEEAMKTSGTLIHETAIRVRQSMPQKVSGSSFSDQCDEINSIVEQALNPAGTQVLSEGKDLDKRYVGKQEPVKVTAKPEKPEAVKHVAVGKKPEQMKGKPEQNKTVKKKYVGESKKTLAEAFMKPEIYEGDAYSVETNQGTFVVPADLASIEMGIGQVLTDDDATFQSAKEALADFVEGDIQEITMDHGWLGRYQAPGYMDATEWALYASKEEAEKELQDMYGDNEEGEEEAEVENESEEGCESEEDEPKEESTLQKMITRLSEKAEKLGESKNKEHRKLAFFISERILPVAMVKSENEGGDKDILKDLSQALRMLASKLADQDEKKDLESMAQTMDAEIVPAAPVAEPVEESKKKSKQSLKEDEDSDEESSDIDFGEYANTMWENFDLDNIQDSDIQGLVDQYRDIHSDKKIISILQKIAEAQEGDRNIPSGGIDGMATEDGDTYVWLVVSESDLRDALGPIESEDEEGSDEPSENDYVMSSSGHLGSKTTVSVDGKKLGEFSSEEEAEKAIKADMKKQNYFTNVWFQDDHGGFVIRKGPWNESKSMKEAKGRRNDLRVGDMVQGVMGVDGGKEGKIEKIGAPFSSSGSATVWVVGEDGKKWDTYDFNLKKVEKLGQPRFANEDVQKEAKEARWLANELDEKYQTMVSQVAGKMHYDINSAMNFCVALLEDVNAHPEAKAVNDALLSFEESKNLGESEESKVFNSVQDIVRYVSDQPIEFGKYGNPSEESVVSSIRKDPEFRFGKDASKVLDRVFKDILGESKNLGEAEDKQSYEALVDLSNGKRLHLTHARGFSGTKESLIQKAKEEAEKKGWEAKGTIKFYKKLDGSESGSEQL
jgi:hypothetical protein